MPTDKIKVLHVIGRFNVGGTANYLLNLLPKIAGEKVEILLAVGQVQSGEVEESRLSELNFVRIESLGRRIAPLMDFKSYLSLRKVVKEFKPDVIHSHTFKAGLLSRTMFLRIPKVHTFHGHLFTDPEFSSFERKVITYVERALSFLTGRFITTGQNVAVELSNRGILKIEKSISIPGQVSTAITTSREEARSNYDLKNEFTILWIARLAPVKNVRLLVEIALRAPELTFLVAGDGPDFEMTKYIAPPNVKMLGFVEARKILSAGDLFVSTSLNEGYPLAVLQAQLAGLPVIAVNVGAVSEIVIHGLTGFLTQPNAEEMERRIRELHSNSDLREKMSIQARLKARMKNLEIEIGKNHLEVYLQAIRDRRQGSPKP